MRYQETASEWEPRVLRELLISALPSETSLHGAGPDPRSVYLPPSHVKALQPDTMVVVGMRGAGKSFWWRALQDPRIRRLVARLRPDAEVEEQTQVEVGFGETPNVEAYPHRDVLLKMLREAAEPRLVWRTVVVTRLVEREHPLLALQDWVGRLLWVQGHPEEVERALERRDQACDREQRWFLILFDALDRSADRWEDMYRLIRGLLETTLEFRPYRRLRLKCFLRSDQLDESRVASFPDASKVLSARVELTWSRPDLYGLLWQYVANAEHEGAHRFRTAASHNLRFEWSLSELDGLQVWRIPSALSRDEGVHRELIHALAGKWMGQDPRRGYPYTWIPGHLADAQGRTSPRSFLAALRAAAEDTRDRYPNHDRALHYESIKRGVQKASEIRVLELKEDYPWVDLLMKPLEGLVVPCDFQDVVQRWNDAKALKEISRRIKSGEERLPPAHLEYGPDGVREDLEELGVFVRMEDGRVNIPDVFRVGYGLGRRGGVKPIRPGEPK